MKLLFTYQIGMGYIFLSANYLLRKVQQYTYYVLNYSKKVLKWVTPITYKFSVTRENAMMQWQLKSDDFQRENESFRWAHSENYSVCPPLWQSRCDSTIRNKNALDCTVQQNRNTMKFFSEHWEREEIRLCLSVTLSQL